MSEQNKQTGHAVDTYFAPAGRDTPENLEKTSHLVVETPLFQAVLDSLDGFLMILNPQRQVLAMNSQLIEALGIEQPACLLGQRPGEILQCIHSAEGPDGCGTAKTCSTCGAVISILSSQNSNEPSVGECLATVKHGDQQQSLEFRVRATPIHFNEYDFTVLAFQDISGDKRREALERTFFHDIMNTIGGLMGWSGLMANMKGLDQRETAERILRLSKRLKQEIEEQRRLLEAENGTLEIIKESVAVKEILTNIASVFGTHNVAKGKKLEMGEVDAAEMITTDQTILERVITNMAKNAFEAISEGETVSIAYEPLEDKVRFRVSNPGVIPPSVALRIFKRSFSTKAERGRGIGTYSMKLFGERYLGGAVGFDSAEGAGTTFWIELPR